MEENRYLTLEDVRLMALEYGYRNDGCWMPLEMFIVNAIFQKAAYRVAIGHLTPENIVDLARAYQATLN